VVDRAGHLYVTGQFQGTARFPVGDPPVEQSSNGGADFFVAKLSADVWSPTLANVHLPSIWMEQPAR
jgi:hypothetical protein